MLHLLVAFVPFVVQDQLAPPDPPAPGCAIGVDTGPDVLVDDPAEADPRVVPEQPHLPVRGEAGTGMEENIVGHVPRVRELGPEPGGGGGVDTLVRIDVEDPLAAGEIERVIAGGGEIVPPPELVQARAARGRDLPGAVGGAGVHDHDLVHQPFQGAEAGVEELRLVLDDEARRQEHAARRGCLRPRRGQRDRRAGKLSTLTPTEIACTASSHVGESPPRRRGALPLFLRARSLHQPSVRWGCCSFRPPVRQSSR